MKCFPLICKDCGKPFTVEGAGNADNNVGMSAYVTQKVVNEVSSGSGVVSNGIGTSIIGGFGDGELFYFGYYVSSLMCPFCRSKNVKGGKGRDYYRALFYEMRIPLDSCIYQVLDIFANLEVN